MWKINCTSSVINECDKSDFSYYKELLIKERIRSLWEQILSFKRSSHLKRDVIEENNCLIQLSPFDVRNIFHRSGYAVEQGVCRDSRCTSGFFPQSAYLHYCARGFIRAVYKFCTLMRSDIVAASWAWSHTEGVSGEIPPVLLFSTFICRCWGGRVYWGSVMLLWRQTPWTTYGATTARWLLYHQTKDEISSA